MDLLSTILAILVVFGLGYDIGRKRTHKEWTDDAEYSALKIYKGNYYKVTKMNENTIW